jgi:hypothetical protein
LIPNGTTTEDSPAPDSDEGMRECVERLREHEHRSIRDAASSQRAHATILDKLEAIARDSRAIRSDLDEVHATTTATLERVKAVESNVTMSKLLTVAGAAVGAGAVELLAKLLKG